MQIKETFWEGEGLDLKRHKKCLQFHLPSYQLYFKLKNNFRKIPFSVIYELRNFDDLTQSGF